MIHNGFIALLVAIAKAALDLARVLLPPNFCNQIFSNNVAPFHAVGGIAMQPNASTGRIKARHALGQ